VQALEPIDRSRWRSAGWQGDRGGPLPEVQGRAGRGLALGL